MGIGLQIGLLLKTGGTSKVLSDLRKAVTDETAKLSDISRQLTGSVAAALATGIGLIAARVATNAPAVLIAIVMLVVAAYVAVVISSGAQFMTLQRQLRADWQHRLYRFLPSVEYERMVAKPAKQAEQSFVWTAWLGGASVFVLTLACGWTVLFFAPSAKPALPAPSSAAPHHPAARHQQEPKGREPPSTSASREVAPASPKPEKNEPAK